MTFALVAVIIWLSFYYTDDRDCAQNGEHCISEKKWHETPRWMGKEVNETKPFGSLNITRFEVKNTTLEKIRAEEAALVAQVDLTF